MEMTEIRKEGLHVAKTGTLDATISEQASEVLGYISSRAAARHENSNHVPPLRAALAKLDISILNSVDVEKYKLEKKHKCELEQLARSPENTPFCYWRDVAIKDYEKPVPEFVLNKAIQIKREVPQCEIIILELDEDPDPFLVVKIGYTEQYYVEVWDEPTFQI